MKSKIIYAISFLSFSLFFIPTSCKKAVDNAQQNAIYEIITNGKWVVDRFIVGGTAKTGEYAGFEFQFFRNGIVAATKEANPAINGTWSLQVENATITSAFAGQDDPLKRFNAIWLVTSASETTVQAKTNVSGEECLLKLIKK